MKKSLKFIKKTLATLLAITMLLPTNIPTTVLATDAQVTENNDDAFKLNIEWGDSKFKDDTEFNIVENSYTE